MSSLRFRDKMVLKMFGIYLTVSKHGHQKLSAYGQFKGLKVKYLGVYLSPLD